MFYSLLPANMGILFILNSSIEIGCSLHFLPKWIQNLSGYYLDTFKPNQSPSFRPCTVSRLCPHSTWGPRGLTHPWRLVCTSPQSRVNIARLYLRCEPIRQSVSVSDSKAGSRSCDLRFCPGQKVSSGHLNGWTGVRGYLAAHLFLRYSSQYHWTAKYHSMTPLISFTYSYTKGFNQELQAFVAT